MVVLKQLLVLALLPANRSNTSNGEIKNHYICADDKYHFILLRKPLFQAPART
jgi:hypothetical protein